MAAVTLIWGAGSAAAGQYTVWSCRGPEGAPISASAWRTHTTAAASGDITIADDCVGGGSLRLEATPPGTIFDHQPLGEAIFEPPPGTTIPKYEVWRYAAAHDGPHYPEHAPYDDYAAGFQEWLLGFGLNRDCGAQRGEPTCEVGKADAPLDEANLISEEAPAEEPPFEKLGFWVGCVRVGCEPALAAPSAVFKLFRSRITIEDDHAPTVERLEGSLEGNAPVTGVATLLVTAGDVGGGVAAFEFSVDGGEPRRLAVGTGKGACEAPYSLPQPCPTTATKSFSLDTAALAPGDHSVSGTVVDAAGNATPFGPIAFTVAAREAAGGSPEAPPPVAQGGVSAAVAAGGRPNNGTPAVVVPRLRIDRAASPRRSGAPAHVRGTLTTPAGGPIAGARLAVEVTELGGGRRGKRQTVRTDAHGRFAFKVGGGGARNVVVSYSPTLDGPVSRTASAVVRSALALRLAARPRRVTNGQTVHFVGKLAGAGRAARGATVEIQAIAGGHWTTVETATVGAHGSFRWSHRFRYVERDALFSFRAVIPRTPGWPWPTVRSPRLRVPIKGVAR